MHVFRIKVYVIFTVLWKNSTVSSDFSVAENIFVPQSLSRFPVILIFVLYLDFLALFVY